MTLHDKRNDNMYSDGTKLFEIGSKIIESTKIKCRLTDNTGWLKCYKDIVFNETMLYLSHNTTCMNTIVEPYLMVNRWPSDNKSFFSFKLDTESLYPASREAMQTIAEGLENMYVACLHTWENMKDIIATENKKFEDIVLAKSATESFAYMKARENELNEMVSSLMQIFKTT